MLTEMCRIFEWLELRMLPFGTSYLQKMKIIRLPGVLLFFQVGHQHLLQSTHGL